MKVTAHRIWVLELRAAGQPDPEDELPDDGDLEDTLGEEEDPALTKDQLMAAASNHTDLDEGEEDDEDDVLEAGEEYFTRLITARTTTMEQALQIFNASREALGIDEADELLSIKLEGEGNHITT